MKIVYDKNDYIAQVYADTGCVVHRIGRLPNNQILNTHIGEKHPNEDWREVRLMGCPEDIRQEIVEAFDAHCATVGGIKL